MILFMWNILCIHDLFFRPYVRVFYFQPQLGHITPNNLHLQNYASLTDIVASLSETRVWMLTNQQLRGESKKPNTEQRR